MITKEEREYLVGSMSKLLREYDYKCTEEALGKIIDRWAEQKADLINGFKNHPNYIEGKFMIVLTSNLERVLDKRGAFDFSCWLGDNAVVRTDLTPKEILNRRRGCTYLPDSLYDFLTCLSDYAERCVSERTANVIKAVIPEVHVHTGEKTSRAIGRILKYLNYDKVEGYEKAYAKYADSLSPVIIKRRTILSINPLDYLTMSFGNSWASCHTIDKKNKRRMENSYGGAYSTGTMSYMLDGTSMVFYTVNDSYEGDAYWAQDKIHRQMFHYGQEKLIQGRLYPQSNDVCGIEYDTYRNIVQSIVSTMFDFANLWTIKTGVNNTSRYVSSYGTHYRDYLCFNNCSISRVKGSENNNNICIGANPICIRCGSEHNGADNIDHCIYRRCNHCGDRVNEDDGVEIDGMFYCKSCAHWCDMCEKWHLGSNTYIAKENIYVCEDCLKENFTKCRWCGGYIRKDSAEEKDGKTYCKSCIDKMESFNSREPMFKVNLDNLIAYINNNRYVFRYSNDPISFVDDTSEDASANDMSDDDTWFI